MQKRILEINPSHPVIENVRRLVEKGGADHVIDEWIEVLFDQAKIAEGSPIDDPARFNRRVTALLADAAERLAAG